MERGPALPATASPGTAAGPPPSPSLAPAQAPPAPAAAPACYRPRPARASRIRPRPAHASAGAFALPVCLLLLGRLGQAFMVHPRYSAGGRGVAAWGRPEGGGRAAPQLGPRQRPLPPLVLASAYDGEAAPMPEEEDEEEPEDEEDIIMRFFQEIEEEVAGAGEKKTKDKSKQKSSGSEGPRPYFKDLALMAEAAEKMPVDFFVEPELAYYKLGGDMNTCRLITGTWQLDGRHGYHPFFLDIKNEIFDMVRVHGYTTFDVAPFYGQVERWLGEVRAKIEDPLELDAYKIFTKLVFPPGAERITAAEVEKAVDASLGRLRALRLDLVQLHWWDFDDLRYLDVLHWLAELQAKGKVRHIGVTNFDAEALVAALDNGMPVVSNTVQFSLLDQRPLRTNLTQVCQERNVTLLAYGTLLGGFLADRWLGEAAPDPRAFTSTSEQKYFQTLRAWGSWEQFQELLAELKAVAKKHRATIAQVALRWVLDQPAVGSVLVGTRLGLIEHLEENKQVLRLQLTAADRENIARAAGLGRDLAEVMGAVGVEYKRAVMDVPERY